MQGIIQDLQLFLGNNPYNNSAQYPARDVMDVICNRYKIQLLFRRAHLLFRRAHLLFRRTHLLFRRTHLLFRRVHNAPCETQKELKPMLVILVCTQ